MEKNTWSPPLPHFKLNNFLQPGLLGALLFSPFCSSGTWFEFKRICCFEDKHHSSAINNDCALSFLWRDLFKVLCCKDLGRFSWQGQLRMHPILIYFIRRLRFWKTQKSHRLWVNLLIPQHIFSRTLTDKTKHFSPGSSRFYHSSTPHNWDPGRRQMWQKGILCSDTMLIVRRTHSQTYVSFDKVFLYQQKFYGSLP